jgi:hypothetical protein
MRRKRKITASGTSGIKNGRIVEMKDIIWIFRSFGFIIGLRFVWDSLVRKLRRKTQAPIFEELNDEEAQQVAWSFGIFRWIDRQDLNDQWNAIEKHTLH